MFLKGCGHLKIPKSKHMNFFHIIISLTFMGARKKEYSRVFYARLPMSASYLSEGSDVKSINLLFHEFS